MINLDTILAPIAGDNPAGENLRYDPVLDAIQEARREDDQLDRGAWERDLKKADWELVITLAVDALSEKTKDLQIAVWLTEALVKTKGFPGLEAGLQLLSGFLETFWDNLYPQIENDDLDYRVGPLQFMNDKVWLAVAEVPLTDPSAGDGFSWLKWREAKAVGADEDAIAEGKVGIEAFEKAVNRSTKSFYETLSRQLDACQAAFTRLDNLIDEKFGREAPRTADFKEAIENCQRFVDKTLKEKRELDPDPEPETAQETGMEASPVEDIVTEDRQGINETQMPASISPTAASPPTSIQGQIVVGMISDTEPHESAVWNNALSNLKTEGLKHALDILFSASCSVSSVRYRNRYRLLMAKLCLQADRPDLARPIAEELNTLVEELGLERWESPVWVADVLGVLYRCLIQEDEGSDDYYRADEIFKKMCTIDLTKALQHRH